MWTLGTLDVHRTSILRAHACLKRDVGGLEVVRDFKGSIAIPMADQLIVTVLTENGLARRGSLISEHGISLHLVYGKLHDCKARGRL